MVNLAPDFRPFWISALVFIFYFLRYLVEFVVFGLCSVFLWTWAIYLALLCLLVWNFLLESILKIAENPSIHFQRFFTLFTRTDLYVFINKTWDFHICGSKSMCFRKQINKQLDSEVYQPGGLSGKNFIKLLNIW